MNTHTRTLASLALLFLIGSILPGCGSQARVIDVDKEGVVNADRINIQDFHNATREMLESLYSSGRLEAATRKPAVVATGRIINDTGEYFDTDLLTGKLIEELQNSDKVTLSPSLKGSNLAEDVRKWKALHPNDPLPSQFPDYTLDGKILKNLVRAGNVKQATYTFQLMLTDTTTGTTIWSAQRQITKQGTRAAVGI